MSTTLLSPSKASPRFAERDRIGLPPISPQPKKLRQEGSETPSRASSKRQSIQISLTSDSPAPSLPAPFSPGASQSVSHLLQSDSVPLLTTPNGKPLPSVPLSLSNSRPSVSLSHPVDGNTSNPVNPSSNSSNSTSTGHQLEYVRVNVTEEDTFLAMLGYKDLNRSIGPDGQIYFREEFCGACGIIHANTEVLDTYYNCKACHCVIREPSCLRIKYRKVKQEQVLEVLFATYGDPYDPALAYDVTAKVQEKLREFQAQDRLVFRPRELMDQIFGRDPAPGKNKQLRVRYRMHGQHATLVLDFNPENKIPVPFLLLAPKRQFLRIYSAMYGHPKGASKTGRMCFDVSEVLQSFVDQNGGSYLAISAYTPLYRLLGDPCPGYTKDLRIEFEIVGRSGELLYSEIRGHLTKRLMLQSTPCVAPILNIQSAFYGITPTSRKDRLDFINKQLKRIDMIDHRRRQGLPVQADDILFLRNRGLLLEQRTIYQNVPTKFIDVSEKIQRIADKGRFRLFLDKDKFDPNEVFGNPLPGQPKILEVLVDCQGHDSERQTDSMEMMDTGYARNFITVKKNRFNIAVNDIPIYGDEWESITTADDHETQSLEESTTEKRRKLHNQGIRASATIEGLQMVSIDAPSTFSSHELLHSGPSVESMLSFSNPVGSFSGSVIKDKGKKFDKKKSNKQRLQGDSGDISSNDDTAMQVSNIRPFGGQDATQRKRHHIDNLVAFNATNNDSNNNNNNNNNNKQHAGIRGSLNMGLFGDEAWMDGDEVVDGEPPDKPRVIGGIYGGNNHDNPRYEQLLTLQKLQEEYRAEYGDADDEERLAATGKATMPVRRQKIVGYKAVMQESLDFQTDYAAPLIIIKRATYGELNDLRKSIDVTRDIQFMVKGRALEITKDMNLNEIFHKDPSPGRRKQLKIEYVMRGFRGNLRVREKNDCLVANVELGYPPVPPPDDENQVIHDF